MAIFSGGSIFLAILVLGQTLWDDWLCLLFMLKGVMTGSGEAFCMYLSVLAMAVFCDGLLIND